MQIPAVNKHIKNIILSNELEEASTFSKMETVWNEGNRIVKRIINTNKVYDRYIIIDRDKLYHLGHSIKDIGKKISTISESDKELIKELLTHLN